MHKRASWLLLLVYACRCVSTDVSIADVTPSNTGSVWQPLAKYFGGEGEYTYALVGDTAKIQVDPVSGVLFGRPPQIATVFAVQATDQKGNVKNGRVRVMPELPSAVVLDAPMPYSNYATAASGNFAPTPVAFYSNPVALKPPYMAPTPQNARSLQNSQNIPSSPSPPQSSAPKSPPLGAIPPPPEFLPPQNTPTYFPLPQQSLITPPQTLPGGSSQVSSVASVSASANVGILFRLEASLFFKSVLPLSFSMTGAPSGSHLAISSQTGTVFGTPGEVDATTSPLNLVIGGTDTLGRFATFTLVLLIQRAPPDPNTVIIAESVPFFYDVRRLFSAAGLSFSAFGLPTGSGLTFQQSGILFGTPNNIDTQATPYVLRIVASNSDAIILRVSMGPNAGFSTISQGKPVPTLNLVQGIYFSVNFAGFISGNITGALYGVVGFPQGTSMIIDSRTGTLFGTPSSVDARAQQPLSPSLIVVTPDNSSLAIQFSVSIRAVHVAPIALPIPGQVVRQGMSLNLNLSPYFSSDDTPVIYAIYTLPSGSGLFLNSQTGLLSGVVTASDVPVSQADTGFRILSVCASTPFNTSCSNLLFIVNSTTTNPLPVISQIPDSNMFQGVYFSLDLSKFVRTSGNSPAFSVQGMPRGTGMSVDSSTGLFSGTPTNPDAQALQPLNLTLFVSDGRTRSQRSWSVNVRWPNRRPVAQPIPVLNATVGSLLQFDASRFFMDPDQDALAFTISDITPDSGFSVDYTSGVFSGVPTLADASVPQPERIILLATDPAGLIAQATLYVSVRKSNSPPVQIGLIPDQIWIQGYSVQLNISAFFSDPDKDVLQYGISGLPRDTGIVISTFNGQLIGTPTMADFNAMQPLRVLLSVIDGQGGRIVTDFFVTIKRGNRAPIALPIPAAYVTMGRSFSFSAAPFFADEDGDNLAFDIEGLPFGSGVAFNSATGELSGIPNDTDLQASQPLELLVWVSDGKERSRGRIFLTVRPANRPPYADFIPPGSITQAAFFSMSFSDFFHDPDNEALTYVLEGLPLGSGLNLDSKRGQLSGRPNEVDVLASPILLFVTGSDGRNGTARTSFQLRVQKVNVPPVVALIPNAQAIEGTPFWKDLGMSFTDPDTDRLTFQIIGLPDGSGLSLNPSSGQLEGTPTAADITTQTPRALRVSANDGRGGITQAQFFLSVRPKTFVPTSQTIPPQKGLQGVLFKFLSSSYFTNATQLKFSIVGLPPGTGLFMDQSGVLSGVLSVADRMASPLSLIIVAQEPMGGQASVPLFLVVAQQNRPPVATIIPPATLRVGDLAQISMSSFFQDPDGQALTFEMQGLNRRTGFSFNRLTGLFSGVASMDDFLAPQPLRLQITVSDSCGGITSSEFIVTVLPLNHPPTVNNDAGPIPVALGQPVFLNVGRWFADADDDTLSFALNGLVSTTGFQIDEDTGLVTGSLNMDDCSMVTGGAPFRLNVSATDGVATISTIVNILGCPFRVVLPAAVAQIFMPFTYDGSQGFAASKLGPLTFDLVGDATSWLSIRADTGVLNGRPAQSQCSSGDLPSFVNITITGTAGQNMLYATLQIKIQCAIQPVKAKPIPPATAIGGQMFFSDMSSRFDYAGPTLKYQIAGLPGGTGLALNPSGVITGIPNRADCGMAQPLALKINVQDSSGNTASGRFFLTIKCSPLADPPPNSAVASSATSQPQSGRAAERVCAGQVLYLDLGSKLTDQVANAVFSLSALPAGTGFSINPRTGVVSGTPTSADCQQASSTDGPTLFRILAQGDSGAQAGLSLFVQVDCSASQGSEYGIPNDSRRSFEMSSSTPIIASLIPLQVMVSGMSSKIDLRSYFGSNQSLVFTVVGLSPSSGLTAANGLIRGTPRCNSNPSTIGVHVAGTNGGIIMTNFSLVIFCATNSTDFPPVSTVIPDVYVQAGSLLYFDLSAYFAEPKGANLVYTSVCKTAPCAVQISSEGIVTGQITSPLEVVVTATGQTGLTTSSELRLRIRGVSGVSTLREQTSNLPLFAHGQQGQRFSFNFSNASTASRWLSYNIQGLTRGTGLTFDSLTGRLWGIPALVDAIASQPLVLSYTAQNSRETMSGVLLLTVARASVQADATCEALGWDSIRGKNGSICGSSLVNQGICSGPVSFSAASRLCSGWGARLCSTKELSDDEVLGTGCGLDAKLVWSSSECAGGVLAVAGSSQASLSKCAPRNQLDLFSVRCCAQSRFSPFTKNTMPTVSDDIPIFECRSNQSCIFDTSVYFAEKDGDSLTFTVAGLPLDSGFQMGLTTGVLSGVPTQADFDMAGFGNISAILSVTADDGRGGWAIASIQLVFSRPKENSHQILKPLSFTVNQGEVAIFSVESAFAGASNLVFSQVGLPLGSGLTLDRASGIISGTPNQVDQDIGLLQLSINARDARGSINNVACYIRVLRKLDIVSQVSAMLSLGSEVAYVGARFQLDCAPNFQTDGPGWRFAVNGLLASSGLSMTPSGMLIGIPNQNDLANAPYVLSVSTFSMTQRLAAKLVLYVLPAVSITDTSTNQSLVINKRLIANATEGQSVLVDLTPIVSNPANDILVFQGVGILAQSGLRVMESGVLIGVPNGFDSSQPQPLVIGVMVSGPRAQMVGTVVNLFVASRSVDTTAELAYRAIVETTNRAPQGQPIPSLTVSVGRWTEFRMQSFFSDPDNDPLIFSQAGLPRGSGLALENGVIFGTPNQMDLRSSPMRVRVTASDGLGGTTTQTVGVVVNDVLGNTVPNRAPVASDIATQFATESKFVSIDASKAFSDPDAKYGDILEYTLEGLPTGSGLHIVPSSGVIMGTLSTIDLEQKIAVFLTVMARDSRGLSATTSFQLIMARINDPPVTIPFEDITVATDSEVQVDLSKNFYDPSGESLVFTQTGLPSRSGLSLSDRGALTGHVFAADVAAQPLQIVVSASNSRGFTTLTLALSVQKSTTGPNRAPTLIMAARATRRKANSFVELPIWSYFVDPDGDELHFEVSRFPPGSGLALVDGVLSGTLSKLDGNPRLQPRVFNITAIDSHGASATMSIPLRVDSANTAPLSTSIPVREVQVGRQARIDVSVNFFDPDLDDVITFKLLDVPQGSDFTIEAPTGIVSGTPSLSDYEFAQLQADSTIKLTVMAIDAQGATCTSILSLRVKQRSTASCEKLGWAFRGMAGVCSESQKDGKCPLPLAFAQAVDMCDSMEARLCTTLELESGIGLKTKCGTDRVRVWSADSCKQTKGKGVVTQLANGTKDMLCATRQETAKVLCCADARDLPESTAKPKQPGIHIGPILLGNIPPVLGIVGSSFVLEVWPYFLKADDATLTYSLSGLPPNTGLTMLSDIGILTGIPTNADLGSARALFITASDGRGGKIRASLTMDVQPDIPALSGPQTLKLTANLGKPFSSSLASKFAASSKSYRMSGAPAQSGFSLDSTGLLKGTPTATDFRASPLTLIVTAVTPTQSTKQVIVELMVVSFSTIRVDPIPPLLFFLGIPIDSTSFINYFRSSSSSPLTMSGSGLPLGSGLSIQDGSVIGRPNSADLIASRGPEGPGMVIQLLVSDSQGGTANATARIEISPPDQSSVELQTPIFSKPLDVGPTFEPDLISGKTCSQLGWALNFDHSQTVCSETRGICSTAFSYDRAAKQCAGKGARPCLQSELEQGVGIGTPCETSRVWTNTRCGSANATWVITRASGSDQNAVQLPERCTDINELFPIQCCADAIRSIPKLSSSVRSFEANQLESRWANPEAIVTGVYVSAKS